MPKRRRGKLFAVLFAAGTLMSHAVAAGQSHNAEGDRDVVLVGVVAYDDSPVGTAESIDLLQRAVAKSEKPLRFKFAVGTYGDIEHWINQGLVDLAIATPGLFSDSAAGRSNHASEERGASERPDLLNHVRYLATVGAPPATSPFARPARKEDRYHDRVFSLALVSKNSTLHSADDLERAAHEKRLRCLLVHPLSVSGSVAPQFALHERGVDLGAGQIEYTHSHSESIRILLADSQSNEAAASYNRRETVAFVWDDALRTNPEAAESLRVVPFPELDVLSIPQEMIVARSDFSRADEVTRLLLAFRDASGRQPYNVPSAWQALRGQMLGWQSALQIGRHDQSVTLGEIGRMLVHFAHTQTGQPRLALVLSGGGAKCSYQVGAVSAIEEQLAKLRTANPDIHLDIDLVVGTSGGAINALPIALGITSSAEGREQFRHVWLSLDQRDIVRPTWVVCANIGLWFAILQFSIVLLLVRRTVRNEASRGWWAGGVLVGLGLLQVSIAYLQWSPWRALGTSHVLHHVWLWLSFGAEASAAALIVGGTAVLLAQIVLRRRRRFVTARRGAVGWLVAIGLVGLPLLQMVTVLFFQDTLSGGEGMEHALAEHYPALIDGELARRGRAMLELKREQSDSERLKSVARQLVARGLVSRDLVITGSRLKSDTDSVNALASDLYFYLAKQAEDAHRRSRPSAPPFGNRGISLADRPEMALDVVLGSGSIFPVFPSRRLRDFPASGAEMELVDGGFAHNSPIEAAVLWGATHIVLIEASPQDRLERSNFAGNAAASFAHLYEQSQLLDARSRGKVVIFTLAPTPPHLCVLDFADNLVEDAIDRGYGDASGSVQAASETVSAGVPRFRKELGEPVFVENAE